MRFNLNGGGGGGEGITVNSFLSLSLMYALKHVLYLFGFNVLTKEFLFFCKRMYTAQYRLAVKFPAMRGRVKTFNWN